MLATLLCQSVGPASDLKSVGNSLVPVCCLASDLRSFYLRSEANQQTDTRELPTYLRSEAKQQTGTRELQTDLGSEVNQQTGTR
jgi:hypothetical protein